MTIAEFKAWLDGFEAAMDRAPTAAQWAAIKAKLNTVTEKPVTTYRESIPKVWLGSRSQFADGAVDRR